MTFMTNSGCGAAAFGTRKPMLITSTKDVILIILSFIILCLAAALMAR